MDSRESKYLLLMDRGGEKTEGIKGDAKAPKFDSQVVK